METRVPDLRLKIPCSDEGDFYARFAHHVARRGLRVPTEEQRPVGTPVTIALDFRNGGTLIGEGVIDAHVRMEARPGVNVRIHRLEGGAGGGAPFRAGGHVPSHAPSGPSAAAREGLAALPEGDEPLGDVLFADASEVGSEPPPPIFESGTLSAEIVAVVNRRAARVQRAAIAVAVAALVAGAAGLAAMRWLPPISAEAAWAAHVEVSDRLLAEGRLIGEDGALEHLLAAKRLRPEDAATSRRLSHVADLLEALAARALERGDVAVAAIHLTWAERAAPGRASIRDELDAIAKRAPSSESPAPPRRRAAGAGKRPAASR